LFRFVPSIPPVTKKRRGPGLYFGRILIRFIGVADFQGFSVAFLTSSQLICCLLVNFVLA